MDPERPAHVLAAYERFFRGAPTELDPVRLFHRVAASVPAYRSFLDEHGVDPDSVVTREDFARLPLTDKAGYLRRHPLPRLCRDGRPDGCDMVAVSSGSSGPPTVWPRSLVDELDAARRFEQVFRQFGADVARTLAVVCFPLGTWVGGLFTTACVRHLAAKGFPVTVVAPGNNPAEILRTLPELAPYYDQVVLLGYPPFVKSVIDAWHGWAPLSVKLVLAGEVFSEDWRDLMAERAGMGDVGRDSAALYGTADAGVLGTETALSVGIRRFLAGRPELARELFGGVHLPSLLQYDPGHRYFEVTAEGTLVLTADSGVPLVRYHLADEGGLVSHADMTAFCRRHGHVPPAGEDLPFVFVFGRSMFTVSFFGANVYPENVMVGLEQPAVAGWLTGKFVLEVVEDADRDRRLRVVAELAAGSEGDPAVVAESVRDQLIRHNSEFAHYVPAERRLPDVELRPAGDPEYFPVGVKHRYTRRP